MAEATRCEGDLRPARRDDGGGDAADGSAGETQPGIPAVAALADSRSGGSCES